MQSKQLQDEKERCESEYNRGNYKDAIDLGLRLIQNPDFIVDKKSHSFVLNVLGNSSMLRSRFSDAITYYDQACQINLEIDNKEGLAAALGNIGLAKQNLADFTGALDFYEKAIAINEQIGNKRFLAINLGNVGIVFARLPDYAKALDYYEKAMKINIEIENEDGLASNFGNIGLIYLDQAEYDKALDYFQKAIAIHETLGNKKGIGSNLGNIGNVYLLTEDYEKGLDHHFRAIAHYEVIGNMDGQANSLGAIGSIYGKQKKYEMAIKSIQRAIEIAVESESLFISMNCYYNLSELYEEVGDHKQSLDAFKQHIAIKERIQSDDTKRQAILFDQKRALEEQEKENQLKLARLEEQEKLLHNILPMSIADRLLKHESFIADYYTSVSILFMDLVGFTDLSSKVKPKQLVYILDTIFSRADEIIDRMGLEKIKTIGDGYLAVANLTSEVDQHQIVTAKAALDILSHLSTCTFDLPEELQDEEWMQHIPPMQVRIGIHTGDVVAGIIGKNKFVFDLWGDAVNIASRMESTSQPGKIHVSDTFASHIIHDSEFQLIPRESIEIKGKGMMNTFWLENQK
ncbi:MAG: hypothetical protein RLZZ578_1656 [Bacteroidota bacterium]